MNKSAVVQFRISQELKTEALQVFENMGLSMTDAIHLFLKQAIIKKAIPFEIVAINDTPNIKEISNV